MVRRRRGRAGRKGKSGRRLKRTRFTVKLPKTGWKSGGSFNYKGKKVRVFELK